MDRRLTADDARQSLTAHVEAKGIAAFCQYGRVGWSQLQQLIRNQEYVRYPCEVKFAATELLPGEIAHPVQKGERPEDGFTLYVHPRLARDLDRAAYIVLYQLVAVNYGAFAAAEDAETFGAAALGLTRDEYYAALCALADELSTPDGLSADPPPGGLRKDGPRGA